MTFDPHSPDARFRPLRPASHRRVLVAFAAAAALHSRGIALIRGPQGRRVVWDIERESVGAEAVTPRG